MTAQKQLPDNINQAVNLISAIMQRIMNKRLDKSHHKSLCTSNLKGARA